MNYGHPTTRKFPRSLQEAFCREHANPIEHFARPGRWLRRIACLSAAALIGALVAWGV